MPATYTIAAAARLCGVARRTLQRAVRAGRLLLTVDHQVTLDALRQAGYAPAPTPQRQTAATPQGHRSDAPQAMAQLIAPLVERLDRIITLMERLEAVGMSQGRTAATPQRHVAGTPPGRTAATRRRDAAAPPAATASQTPADAAATPGPPRRAGRPPGPLRQQILALLQAHPEGLRAEELRVYLQTPRPIGDTLQGMLKGGVITAQGRGGQRRYVATAPSRHDHT